MLVEALMRFGHRVSAFVLMLALAAGQAGLCAGWTPTPESRMACCAEGGACPMHDDAAEGAAREAAVTQAEADSCCAASEQDESAPTPPSSGPPLVTLAVVVGPVGDLRSSPQPRRAFSAGSVPIPASGVPKHLLLSVFLV